ncbi:MAG TPA: peptidyl-prolyl cis-trans isomerase [Gemmatimonadaceae bacterium]
MLQQMRSAAKWIWWFVVIFFVGGFLLIDTSGLLGRGQITTSTPVASVNGVDIPYLTWMNLANALAQQREQATGQGIDLDQRRQIEDQAFEQLVTDILLQQEYQRRGIGVTAEEIIQAAQVSPPPMLMADPSLQTNGQFDPEKYQRLLRSPQARQGLLVQLENYYRTEIPRAKLYAQVAGNVYVSDDRLWAAYRDEHDSAKVSFVTFDPATVPDSAVQVPEDEIRRFYDSNRDRFERPGRAVLSLLTIPRPVTAADTAFWRNRALELRQEIVEGRSTFEQVAQRESADTASGSNGGLLGMTHRNDLVDEFANAAFRLRIGEVSEPVLSPYGFHLIKVEQRKGDSVSARHILVRIHQSDSSALAVDRLADNLVRIAASATDPAVFDSAARQLNLQPERVQAFEGQPVFTSTGVAAGVSGWAFSGPRPGESSELFDTENAYYLARLDTLVPAGIAPFQEVREDIRGLLMQRKKAEALVPDAREFAQEAARRGLEAAARDRDITVVQSNFFARPTFVPGIGRLNAAVGAAFSLPIGQISEPIVTDNAVVVLRVDQRKEASREAWEAQKEAQRQQALNGLRQARIRDFMEGLRERAKIEDHRARLNAAARQQAAT